MFAGTGGSGVKDMPSPHSIKMEKKCITCHMYSQEDTELKKGGHTFRLNYNVCLKCHHKDPEVLMSEWREKIPPMLEQLKSLLDNHPDKTSKVYKSAKRNYDMVIADGGIGIHNPRYAQALLQYGISSLSSESAWR